MNNKNNKEDRIPPADIAAMAASYILNLLFPPKCVICGELIADGGEMCPDCLMLWDSARREKCPICQKTARACSCRPYSMFQTDSIGERCMISLAFYSAFSDKDIPVRDKVVSKTVWSIKTSSNRTAARFAARELAGDILRHFAKSRENITEWTLTYPPRTAARRREYGFDQGRDMARLLSKYTGIPMEECFVNKGKKTQKKLNSVERKQNAESAYAIRKAASPNGKKYILIDDIITTGATVNACAELLKKEGAVSVFPVCIARTKRKKHKVRRPSSRPWFKFNTKV